MENTDNFIVTSIVGLECNNLCQQVQNLVNKYVERGGLVDNSFLRINIVNPSCTIDPELPKIEKQ